MVKTENRPLKRRSGALQEKVRLMIKGDSIALPVNSSSLVHQAMEEEECASKSAVPEQIPYSLASGTAEGERDTVASSHYKILCRFAEQVISILRPSS